MTHEVKTIDGKRVASTEYRSWQMMKNRCLNPKAQDYRYYGGRGIAVCPQWLTFAGFLADMGRKPDPALTLERRDSNGNYEPDNCEWATRKTQTRNRAYARTRAWELAEKLGVAVVTAHHMIWQVRAKDRGDEKWFGLSPERETQVREFLG